MDSYILIPVIAPLILTMKYEFRTSKSAQIMEKVYATIYLV